MANYFKTISPGIFLKVFQNHSFVLKTTFAILILIQFACGTNTNQTGITVTFPKPSEPVQITDNEKEHLFASYYGINSWSANQRYVTVLQTDIKHRLPDENDPATLGLVDLETNEFIPLTQTRAWNFQQGCMAHWLGTSPDSLIIYNDFRESRFVSVILNVHTKKEIKTIPYPVSAVSPNGNWMITDTYPSRGLREQKIYLMDMETEAVLPMGRFVQPEEFTGHWRCDIHCRWSLNGDMIGFNSTHTGSRQVYIIKFDEQ